MATQWIGTSLIWKRTYLPYIFSSWDCDCWHGFRTTDLYFFQTQELWVTTSDWWKKSPKTNDNISQKFWLAGAVRAATDIILTNDELPSCQVNRVIGVFAYGEKCVKTSFNSHYAVPSHVEPSQLMPSMVSHEISNPNMFLKADLPVPDLWSKIVEIHRSRSTTGKKRVRA